MTPANVAFTRKPTIQTTSTLTFAGSARSRCIRNMALTLEVEVVGARFTVFLNINAFTHACNNPPLVTILASRLSPSVLSPRACSRCAIKSFRPLLPSFDARSRRVVDHMYPDQLLAGPSVAYSEVGVSWRMLPKQLGYGSGMTCWRRLRDWQHAGIWDLTHFVLLNWLSRNGQIDWSHAVVDSCSVPSSFRGRKRGRIRPIEPNGAASAI